MTKPSNTEPIEEAFEITQNSKWCHLTPIGYVFSNGRGIIPPDFEGFKRQWEATLDLTIAQQWGLGDLYLYGEQRFSEFVAQIVENKRIRPKTLANYVYVCRHLPKPKRRPELSFSHHAAAAALFGNDKHPEWEAQGAALLQAAIDEDLTEDEVTERAQAIQGKTAAAEPVEFEKRPIPDRVDWLITKTQNLQKDMPDEWTAERQLLQDALADLHACAESIKNRSRRGSSAGRRRGGHSTPLPAGWRPHPRGPDDGGGGVRCVT